MGMAIKAPHYTIDDIDRMPEDGNRYELLDGMLLVTPSPSLDHQRVATSMAGRLLAELGASGIVVAPGASERGTDTQLQPDILVFSAAFDRAKTWREISGAWLAIEVLSPSSKVYDREFKRDAYFTLGVREVWIVDLNAKLVEVSRAPGTHAVIRDVVRWNVPDTDRVISIDLAEMFCHLS
jgi:Uma2 family endonuclease